MPGDKPRCPVLACNMRKDKWGTSTGYQLGPMTAFTLLLNPTAQISRETLICRRCYDRDRNHSLPLEGRTRVAPYAPCPPLSSVPSSLDQLIDAAQDSGDFPFPSSSSSSSSNSSPSPPHPTLYYPLLPLPPPSPFSSSSTSVLHSPTHSLSAPLMSPLPLKDITNTHTPPSLPPMKRRRLSPTMGEKERVVRALSDVPRGSRSVVMRALGVDSSALYHYKQSIDNNRAKPQSEQRPLTARRSSGGGRKSMLTKEQEAEVKQHVLSLRRSPARPRVTRVMVAMYIKERYDVELGRKGIAGLMRRQRLSERKRTTTKEVNTPRMLEIKRHWTNKFASFFATTNHQWIINIDETSVYRDAPGDRTIDEIGAKTVEIGSTQHDADRVAILLCINRAGTMFTPLIIHKSTSKKKVLTFTTTSVRVKRDEKEFDVKIWVTYAPKGWLNGSMMMKWLELVYKDELVSRGIRVEDAVLFMDNCSAHDSDEVVAMMKGEGIKHEFFPPKCTPILQPLDQNVNQLFGYEYAKQWERWYMTKGAYDFTPAHNLRRAKDEEVNKWIAHALVSITPHIVRVSWERATSAPLHLLRLPPRPWERIRSFLSPRTGQVLTARRVLYDGSQFIFPVKKKRKRKVVVEAVNGSGVGEERKEDGEDDEDEEEGDEWVGEWGDEEEEDEEEEEEEEEEAVMSPPGCMQLRLHPGFSVI
jgi:hypothetical protein